MLKSEELRQELESLKATAKDLTVASEITARVDEIKALKAKIELAELDEEEARLDVENKTKNIDKKKDEGKVINKGLIIAKAIAGKELTDEEKVAFKEIKNTLIEGDKTKGGIVITPDISTMIIEFQDATRNFDIRPYVNVEPVGTMKGSRAIADNEPEASGFASVDETADIQALHEPTFTDMEYQVRKYAGYIPLTNELLEDSAENILAFIVKWMSENEVNTYAFQVFHGTGVKSAQGIITEAKVGGLLEERTETIDTAPTIKKFKTIFNVDLEEVENTNLVIFTNADGYDYLDGLEDKNGKGYLQPDATAKSGYTFLGREIVKVPKKFLANVTGSDSVVRTPFVMGNLKALYTVFDRKKMSIEDSNIAGEAWRKDTTEVKGIFRFDGKLVNKKAIKVLFAKLG